ncbi:MAG: DUF4334 domain-containing protein [Corynebacterium variabile]
MDPYTARPPRARPGTTPAVARALFDSLPPVQVEDMLGNWHGAEVSTGNPLDGVLELSGWHGKRYYSAEDAHPLVMAGRRGLFAVNPALVPMGLAMRTAPVLRRLKLGRAVRALLPVARTGKPAARLRMVEYRGVVSGTMVYDALPVNDHIRRVDEDTLFGAMDFRARDEPFMFTLHRED